MTTEGKACEKEEFSAEQLDAGREVARLRCEAVARVVEGEDPCGDPGSSIDRNAGMGTTTPEDDCHQHAYIDPGADGSDPCAPRTQQLSGTGAIGSGVVVAPTTPTGTGYVPVGSTPTEGGFYPGMP
jgi:hypothetical protein